MVLSSTTGYFEQYNSCDKEGTLIISIKGPQRLIYFLINSYEINDTRTLSTAYPSCDVVKEVQTRSEE